MERVDFSRVEITGGFFKQKQDMVRNVTAKAVYDRFCDTNRFDAFKLDKNGVEPHVFWDSDVAKWVEGVAYLTSKKREAELEKIVDDLVLEIEKNQLECGYFNLHYVFTGKEHFVNRDHHELYCLGHFIEAGVAYYLATGKRKLLDLMIKYVDYVEKRFVTLKDTGFTTPGHEEIELALIRLYEVTKDERHLKLSQFFVDERGKKREDPKDYWCGGEYNQSHKGVREQDTAEGHSVRATYLYCAMADLAKKTGDVSLLNACKALFDSIAGKRMYITGSIGSSNQSESFTLDYDLPNLTAYTETCASIGLVLFAHRMLLLENDSKYADVIERAIYNGIMSGISLDGKGFYYTNPQELIPVLRERNHCVYENREYFPEPQRREVFECSCCPPNMVRFIPSIANLIYTTEGNTIYVHQFMESKAKLEIDGQSVEIEQKTNYPFDSKIEITVKGNANVCVRVPEWCDTVKAEENGYNSYKIEGSGVICLDYEMTPYLVEANPKVTDGCGKCAIMKGPLVYCMEEIDNGKYLRDITIPVNCQFKQGYDCDLDLPTIELGAYRRKPTDKLYQRLRGNYTEITAKLIPYFAILNRGVGEMQIWHNIK
ncbi:MAG: glycoside hydrolase family 127 protein [Clostridia bacterium]|nr:glycoside hydrolase family 127 protein [Clostridia bacterium]